MKVPDNLDLKAVAPLLCAGITTYSPLRHWKVGKGQKVGVIGLGGLGHMGVKLAKALGAHVAMITTSPEKGKDALRLGADEVLVSSDQEAMARRRRAASISCSTPFPVSHDLNPYLALLKRDGDHGAGGALTRARAAVVGGNLIFGRQDRRRLGDRRHGGDAGDARFLRRARHRQRHRGDPHRRDQRRPMSGC